MIFDLIRFQPTLNHLGIFHGYDYKCNFFIQETFCNRRAQSLLIWSSTINSSCSCSYMKKHGLGLSFSASSLLGFTQFMGNIMQIQQVVTNQQVTIEFRQRKPSYDKFMDPWIVFWSSYLVQSNDEIACILSCYHYPRYQKCFIIMKVDHNVPSICIVKATEKGLMHVKIGLNTDRLVIGGYASMTGLQQCVICKCVNFI